VDEVLVNFEFPKIIRKRHLYLPHQS